MTAGLAVAVLIELVDGSPTPTGYELISAARDISGSDGPPVSAIVLGSAESESLQALIRHGADRVYHASNKEFSNYNPDTWLEALSTVIGISSAQLILMGHSNVGGDLGPRLAFRMGGAIATGCEAFSIDGENITITRACYGNKARENVRLNALPAVVTIRAKVFEPLEPDASKAGEIIDLDLEPVPSRIRVLSREKVVSEGVQLESANIVVSGGRGLGGADGFKVLQELADELGAALGASRVACDLGWCPHTWQVGLSGKTVSPEIYIAVGISGASHHMAGCGRSKAIIAINTDADAPIFSDARFGIIGEYKEIVPAMTEALRRVKNERSKATA